jgi:heptosyltransferase-2
MPRLLLIKFGAVGDVVMTLPAAHAMHLAGYQVDWVCGHAVAPLLRLYPSEPQPGGVLSRSPSMAVRAQ